MKEWTYYAENAIQKTMKNVKKKRMNEKKPGKNNETFIHNHFTD